LISNGREAALFFFEEVLAFPTLILSPPTLFSSSFSQQPAFPRLSSLSRAFSGELIKRHFFFATIWTVLLFFA